MLPNSLLSLLALVTVVVAEPLHVPLTRRSSPLRRDNVIDPARLAKAREFLQNRYGFANAPSKRAGQTIGVPIINSVSVELYSRAFCPDARLSRIDRSRFAEAQAPSNGLNEDT